MSVTNKKFGTAIGCMDGRVIPAVDAFLKEKYGLDFVDQPTEPGPDAFLASGDVAKLESMKAKVLISVNGHGSRLVAVVGHEGCAGNPVEREQHLTDIRKGMEVLASWDMPDTKIVGLWVALEPETMKGRVKELDAETLEIEFK